MEQITAFFADYKLTHSDVVLEIENGKSTGFGLVFFESEARCYDARTKLDKQEIGGRYIDLLPMLLKV